ncbi:hypothetical protein CANINC_003503 [Pichia inconspicua]|uniref:Zn(2)-C6 fungal-type domain-containing protein n=1 Tax=Pichia inconspicua TaxID=52247 RepID=A0A4V6TTQ6_9ASCO|nr:hypothetical protein CANINC_003503 [[Candida] inconspicua]
MTENSINGTNNNDKENSVTNLLNLNHAKSMLNTPGLFPFDLSQWEDNPELNFLLDTQNQVAGSPSMVSNSMSPAIFSTNSFNMNQNKALNQVGSIEMTQNYTEQLQHYQNMLIETQAMLTMKQMQHKGQGNDSQYEKSNIQQLMQSSQHLTPSLFGETPLSNLSNFHPQQQQLIQQQINQLNQSQIIGTPQLKSTNVNSLTANPLMLQSLLTNPLLNQNIVSPQSLNLANGINQVNQQNEGTGTGYSSVSSKTVSRSERKSEPPQPRTKVRPCDHCRRRKTKCVMIQDLQSCKLCQQKGLKCVFNETSLKRSNSANESDGNKRMKFEDPTIEPPPNVLLRNTPPIKDYSAMQGHSLLKKTLSLQFPRSSFYIGPTSIYDPLFLEKVSLDKIDQFQINKANSIRKVADNVQFLLRDDYTELLYEQSERDSDIVEKYVAPHGQTLIDLYFKTVHPSFPVIHKKIFLEKYARTHREFGAPLLAAVYLLAIQWWDFEPKLANVEKPNVVSLYRFALRTFSDVTQRPKLSAVQAGLLLLQCQYICDQPEKLSKDKFKSSENNNCSSEITSNQNNWLICTQVVGLAEELGLGLDCTTWRLPKWEKGLRRRLAWAVYIQDKWSSLVESRPSHIIDNINWIVKPLSDEDFPERVSNSNDSLDTHNNSMDSITNVDIEMGRECFKQSVILSQIVSEIQSTIYSPKAMLELNDIESILKAAKPTQLKLRQWYHSLPKNLQMKGSSDKRFHANGNLHLSYFAAEITLHRRIISILHNQSKVQSEEATSLDSSEQDFGKTRLMPPAPQLVTVCRNAARMRLTASISYVKELTNEHVHSFWHSSAPINFALIGIFAALLCVTSITHEEAAIYCEQLNDYRWALRSLAKEFNIARHALTLLDGVVKNINGLCVDFDNISFDGTVVESVNQTQVPIPTPVSFDQQNGVSNSMNALLRKTQTFNYDLSNNVSPKNVTGMAKSRHHPTSNTGTPNHSPSSNSPLQNMNKPGTTPATPLLVSQSIASTPRQSQPSTTKASSPAKSDKN